MTVGRLVFGKVALLVIGVALFVGLSKSGDSSPVVGAGLSAALMATSFLIAHVVERRISAGVRPKADAWARSLFSHASMSVVFLTAALFFLPRFPDWALGISRLLPTGMVLTAHAINVGFLRADKRWSGLVGVDVFATLLVVLALLYHPDVVFENLLYVGSSVMFVSFAMVLRSSCFKDIVAVEETPQVHRIFACHVVSVVSVAVPLSMIFGNMTVSELHGSFPSSPLENALYALLASGLFSILYGRSSFAKRDFLPKARFEDRASRSVSMALALLAGMTSVGMIGWYTSESPTSSSLLFVSLNAIFLSSVTIVTIMGKRIWIGTMLFGLLLGSGLVLREVGALAPSALVTGVPFFVLLVSLGAVRKAGVVVRARTVIVTTLASVATIALGTAALGGGSAMPFVILGCSILFFVIVILGGIVIGLPKESDRVLWVTKPLDAPFNDGSKVVPRTLLSHMNAGEISICVSRPPTDGTWSPELEWVQVYSNSHSFLDRRFQNLRVFVFLILARYHYRAIHLFFAPSKMACTAVRFLKKISPGVLFVQTIMSRPKAFVDIDNLLFGDVVIAQSEDTRRRILEAGFLGPVLLARPSIDLSTIDYEPNVGNCSQSGIEDGEPFRLLFAGDIDHGGALDHLAAVVPQLLRSSPNILFEFSVRVKGGDTLRRANRFYDEHLSMFGERVRFHVDKKDFLELLDRQNAMIFPAEDLYTKVDTPLVVLETLARGKPVFILDRAPMTEVIPDDFRPRLVASSDQEMVDQLQAFVRDPRILDLSALRRQVAAQFSPEKAASVLVSAYEK